MVFKVSQYEYFNYIYEIELCVECHAVPIAIGIDPNISAMVEW